MGLAVGTGPFASGKDAPVWGFHADNGTAESAASGRYSGKIQLKAMLGRRVEMRAEPSRLPTLLALQVVRATHACAGEGDSG